MSCSNKNSGHLLVSMASLALLVPWMGRGALAQQQSAEERYQTAVKLFSSTAPGSAEQACEIMKQLTQESPGNQDYETNRRIFCRQVALMLDAEKKSAETGIQLARSGKCTDARANYDQIRQMGTKDPRYRDQLKAEIATCDSKASAISNDRARIDQAKAMFHRGKDAEARAQLQPVASGGGSLAQEAKQVLSEIDAAEAKDRSNLDQARGLASQNKKAEARELLKKVAQRGGPQAADARQLLDSMGNASSDEVLRAALKEYFQGDLTMAESDLTSYVNKKGDRMALAYFFRGATHASRYFLSGEMDKHERKSALEDFRIVKERYKGFHPPADYVSPKILQLYSSPNQG